MARRKWIVRFFLLLFVYLVCNLPAEATQVTLNYSGTVDSLVEFSSDDGTGSLGGAVNYGDPVSGSFTYDSDLATILTASMTIGADIQYTSVTSSMGTVFVLNGLQDDFFANVNNPDLQSALTAPSGMTYNELNWMDWSLHLIDSDGLLFTDTSIPGSLNLADFDFGFVALRSWFADNSGDDIANSAWFIRAKIPTVPEPSTVILLGSGLIGLIFIAYQKRRGK